MTEIWKPAVGYAGSYEVSDAGRVRSLDRTIVRRAPKSKTGFVQHRLSGRMLKVIPGSTGYAQVTPCIGGRARPCKIHQMVLLAFVGPCPAGMIPLHADDDPMNPALSNLRYGTHRENVEECMARGRFVLGEHRTQSKLTDQAAGAARALIGHVPQSQLAKAFGVSRAAIKQVKTCQTWANAPNIPLETARVIFSAAVNRRRDAHT